MVTTAGLTAADWACGVADWALGVARACCCRNRVAARSAGEVWDVADDSPAGLGAGAAVATPAPVAATVAVSAGAVLFVAAESPAGKVTFAAAPAPTAGKAAKAIPRAAVMATLANFMLSLIHISEPTRLGMISYA